MADYYAHSKPDDSDRSQWHRLEDHLRQTADQARGFASDWGAADWAYFAGLWHDIGKYSDEFQGMLRAANGEDAHIESHARVDHSTAGAQHADKTLDQICGRALAYVIAGHHGGLPDGEAVDSCLRSRLQKRIPSINNCPPELLESKPLQLPSSFKGNRLPFQYSVFVRMLFSCLVDADFLDTESFVDPRRSFERRGYQSLVEVESAFFDQLQALQQASKPTHVNIFRERVLAQCLAAGERDAGLFSLTVPTGGGKTLSSMAFALRHAIKHGLQRIIYVIPFTSIIEQNATVFREMLGDDVVLEHHSNFEPEQEDHRSRLAADNWDAPVVVTTNVQFFESLFSNKPSRCRKLHNIAKSVVILDEVQALPSHVLLPCLEILRELTLSYQCSIVLCSATQPAVQQREDFESGLQGVREIIENPHSLATQMSRTTIKVLNQVNDADLILRLQSHRQVLCIVSTRKHARSLFEQLPSSAGTFHLSALMCPVHRTQILNRIRERLRQDEPCTVISTQLIEAGVDIDFPIVYRSVAGLDSIAQSAGRCNREGKLKTGTVHIFTPEHGIFPGHIRQTSQAAESVIRKYPEDEILSIGAIDDYFKIYYWSKGTALDENGIMDLIDSGQRHGDFPFKIIAEQFRLITDTMKPVIIPFDEHARRLIETLSYADRPARIGRSLQKYTVSVYPRQWDTLVQIGCLEVKAGTFPVLVDESLYRSDVGLCADDPLQRNVEDLVI